MTTSVPNSEAERASAQRLDASFATCVRTPVEVPGFIRRGIVAYNLYRLLDAARLASGGKEQTGA